jgi:hypothetical protein
MEWFRELNVHDSPGSTPESRKTPSGDTPRPDETETLR